jgi:inosose dehydratase
MRIKEVGVCAFVGETMGDVDFAGVLEVLKEIGYDGWIVVERDVLPGMDTPKESA